MPNATAFFDYRHVLAAGRMADDEVSNDLPVCPTAATTAQALLRWRRARDRSFGSELFRDPAWDMLLDLYVAAGRGRKISVSSACGASNVPTATALRFLTKLEKMGAITRTPDEIDGRTVHVELTPETLEKLTRLLGRMALHS